MKKTTLLLILFFASFYVNSQSLLSIQGSTTIDSNTPFKLELNPTSAPLGCTSQTIVLNIGKLVYLSNNNTLSNGALVTSSIGTDGNTTLTISNILNAAGGISQTLLIGVMFAEGTCDGFTQEVVAIGTPANCSFTPVSSAPSILQLTARTENNVEVRLFQYSSENPACFGKTVKYRVTATNLITNGNIITNTKLFLELPECAQVIGLYKYNSYLPVQYADPTITSGIKTLEWNTPDLNPTQPMSLYTHDYDIYVIYPCDANCFPQQQNANALVRAYLKGESCDPAIEINSAYESLTTPVISCPEYNCQDEGNLLVNFFPYFPCPDSGSCGSNPYVQYRVNISPTSPSYPNLVFTTSIPAGLNIISVTRPSLPCAPVVSAFINGNWVDEPTSFNLATQIKWTYNCIAFPPIDFKYFRVNFNYGANPPLNNSSLVFTYSLMSNSTVIASNSSTAPLQNCAPDIMVNKYVKKATVTTYSNSSNGIPGEKFTYRLRITNIGAIATGNSIIEDVLDGNTQYAGNLKYSFVDSNVTPSNFTPIYASSININGLGSATIETPSLNSQTLRLSGFSIPSICPVQKILYLEFDVIIKSNAIANTNINNVFKVVQNSITRTSTATTINVSALTNVRSEMFVSCPATGEWVKSVDVPSGQELNFKMRLVNDGSLPVSLLELINLKPQIGDTFELGNVARNSEFSINYSCMSGVSILPQTPASQVNILYSNTGIDLDKSALLCPPPSGGNPPNWVTNCSASSNWLRAQFVNGLTLLPGDFIEVIYKGIVSGTAGLAFNTFAFKVNKAEGGCINSDNSDIIVINIDPNSPGCFAAATPCDYCASFDLIKEKKYLVSGWVKESNPATPKLQVKKYEKVCIGVSFTDASGLTIFNTSNPYNSTPQKFYPTGEIIDGWQRIIGEFFVPINAEDVQIELINENTNSNMAYFDDIRVLPSNGNMKSFVYDQKTQRLMAELDENNYSTFYEYDLEGGLIRIKKETEKGVFTIQETRSGNPKANN